MLMIRMRADKVILSFLLLAGIGCSIAEDGYEYIRPSIGFSDGYKNVGLPSQGQSQQYVVPSSTVKPAVVFGGFNQGGQQQQIKITPRPQTSVGGSQGFVQKPAVTTTTFSQFGQQAAKPAAGQYQKSQTTFQGFTNSAGAKPQTNFGVSQSTVKKTVVTTGQYKAPVVDTLKLQTGFEGLQGFGQSQKPLAIAVQYQKPAIAKVQTTFQGLTTSVGSKPQTNFGGIQSFGQTNFQKPTVTSTPFGQSVGTGQYQKPLIVQQKVTQQVVGAGQYQKPLVSQQKPIQKVVGTGQYQKPLIVQQKVTQHVVSAGQYKKPLVSQQNPEVSYLPPQSQTGTTHTSNRPQVAFQGFTSSAGTPRPVVTTVRPQASFGGLQGFSQSSNQKPAFVTGQSQKPSAVRPQIASQGFPSSASYKPLISTSKPQTSYSAFQSSGQSSGQKPVAASTTFGQFGQQTVGTSQYKKPLVSQQKPTQKVVSVGQYQKPIVSQQKPELSYLPPKSQQSTLNTNKPQVAATPRPVVATVRPQTSFSGSQSVNQLSVQKPGGQYQKPATQVTFQGFTSSASPRPVIATVKPQTSFGVFQSSGQKPAVTTTTFSQFGQVPTQQVGGAGQYQKPLVSQQKPTQYQKPLATQQKLEPSYLPPQSQTITLTANKPQVAFQGFTSSAAKPKPVVATIKPQTSFSGFKGFSQTAVQKPAVITGQYQKPATINVAKTQGSFQEPTQYQKPLAAQEKPEPSYLPPQSQTITLTANKPQVAFQGFTSSAAKPKPVVATTKPQTSFSGFQGFSQTAVQKPVVITAQYQKPATVIVTKPQVAFQGFTSSAGSKPQTGLGGFQGFSQNTVQKPAVVSGQYQGVQTLTAVKPQATSQGFTSSVGTKPQTSFNGFQGFGQTTVQKPAVITEQYQKPATINVAKPQGSLQEPTQYQKPLASQQKPEPSYLPPQSQTITLIANKPQVAFQGFTSSAANPKPVVATIKPQTSLSGFQGFSQTAVQKPAVITGQYQKPATVIVAKPQVAFQGFTSSAGSKPQTGLSGFQGFSQNTVQKPSVVSGQYQGVQTLTVVKPQATSQGFTSSVGTKPQTSFSGFQGFGQTTVQKPAVVTGQYQKPATINVAKPQGSFQEPTQYQKPLASQQKPEPSYLPPQSQTITLTANKPQVAFQGFTAAKPKPVVATIKPQTSLSGFQGFSQTAVQKPAVITGQYQKPATVIVAKPQVAFQGFTSSAGSKPQSGFQGFSQTTTTVQKPTVVSGQYQGFTSSAGAKPQTVFSGFQGFGQTTAQKPTVVTGQYQKPAIAGFTSTAFAKPQTGLSGFQGFSQTTTTVQKPTVVSGQYQGVQTFTAAKPQGAFQGFTSTAGAKPQTGFTGFQGFGQTTVPKPAVVIAQYQKPATITVAKPQGSFQGFTSTAFAKPQTGLSGFQGFSQTTTTVQKPTVVSGQYQGVQTLTATKPQGSFQGFTSSVGTKPQTGFTGFQGFSQTTKQRPAVVTGQYQKPAVLQATKPQVAVTTTTFSTFGQQPAQPALSTGQYRSATTTVKPVVSFATTVSSKYTQPSQNLELEYLPPVGAAVPKNAFKSSGAPSQSVFELSSTTANQVVDAAQEKKVAGFVTNENTEPAQAYTGHRSGLPSSVAQTVLSAAQAQKVEKHYTLIDPYFGGQTITPIRKSAFQFTSATPKQAISTLNTGSIVEITGNAPDQLDQFGEVQSQTLPALPTQQIVKSQLTVLDRGQTSVQGSYQVGQSVPTGRSLNVDQSENGSVELSSSSSNRYDDAQWQVQDGSPVQSPQPLNPDEQQVRRLQEKVDSDKEEAI